MGIRLKMYLRMDHKLIRNLVMGHKMKHKWFNAPKMGPGIESNHSLIVTGKIS